MTPFEMAIALQEGRKREATLLAELAALKGLIERPHIGEWADEVILEAAHQKERWGTEHDEGKDPQDWFWLVGHLVGKALRAHIDGDDRKARHHTVSAGAVLAHWAAHIDGIDSVFRPGLGPEKLAQLGRG